MTNTKAGSKVVVSLLCAVLIFNSLPLNAAGAGEEIRHEAFLRGGNAISVALNAPTDNAPVVSKRRLPFHPHRRQPLVRQALPRACQSGPGLL
jgi:hypothetical protein